MPRSGLQAIRQPIDCCRAACRARQPARSKRSASGYRVRCTVVAFWRRSYERSRRIDPDLATWLGSILSSARMEQGERDQALLHLRDATFRMADGKWGPAAFMPHGNDRAGPDEQLISEFVPSEYVLSGDYTGDAISLYELARGSGHLRQPSCTGEARPIRPRMQNDRSEARGRDLHDARG